MTLGKWTASVLSLALFTSALAFAADDAKPAAGEEKAAKKTEGKMEKKVRVIKPWSQITTLTDDQKAKISELHKKALEEKNAIEDKEEKDILALLTEEQKTELKKVQDDQAAARKAKKPTAAKEEAGSAAGDAEKAAK